MFALLKLTLQKSYSITDLCSEVFLPLALIRQYLQKPMQVMQNHSIKLGCIGLRMNGRRKGP